MYFNRSARSQVDAVLSKKIDFNLRKIKAKIIFLER